MTTAIGRDSEELAGLDSATIHPELISFTDTLAYELGVIRSLVNATRLPSNTSMSEVAARLYPSFETWLDERLAELERLTTRLTGEDRALYGQYFRAKMRPYTNESIFLARTNARPRGYAGDSEMMRMIYEEEFRGDSIFGCLLHMHPLQAASGKAVRHRIGLVARALRARRERSSSGAPLRVMSLACGPARELRDLVTSASDASDFDVLLADQDPLALEDARAEIDWVERAIGAKLTAETRRLSVRDVLNGTAGASSIRDLDAIYTLGLFDYLPALVAKRLIIALTDKLRPGGTLIVGNFHVACSTRTYLELWADWPLIYRTKGELLALADDVVGERHVEMDPTRSQMFLFLTKP